MTLEQLRRIHGSRPFRPFTMYMADGRSLTVPHPEMLWVPPQATRTVHVEVAPDVSEYVDLLLVASIQVGNGKASHNGRKKR